MVNLPYAERLGLKRRGSVRVAATSLDPAPVRPTTASSSSTKFTGWIVGNARSVNAIRPIGVSSSRVRQSARERNAYEVALMPMMAATTVREAAEGMLGVV